VSTKQPIPSQAAVEGVIRLLRGQRVILDVDAAALYGVPTKRLNEQVKRNLARFPEDFLFQLTPTEAADLRSQSATSKKRGGRRYLPYAFTEHGAAMLANVLKSPRAILVSVEIVRAFVRLRRFLAENHDLAEKLAALEKKYDRQFSVVFEAIRRLMVGSSKRRQRRIGFRPE
jgi:hypothetical protein